MQVVDNLKQRILSGYAYSFRGPAAEPEPGMRRISINTGQGGVFLMIDALRGRGLPDSFIEDQILVHLDIGTVPLSLLTIKPRSDAQANDQAQK